MDFANGLSADHFDTEMHFDLFPHELDFSYENAGLGSFPLPTMGKHDGREEGFPLFDERPPPKRVKVEEVFDFLDVVMEDDFIDDWLMEGDVVSPSVEVDIDGLVSIIDSDEEGEGAEKENKAPVHDSRIPLPSKKWMPPCASSVCTTSTSTKKAKQAKKVLPVIAVQKVHVEERSLSTAQKAKHKLWVIKRKRCLTGFKGYRCPAKSLAARSKARANGRFQN
jgi:hypothetical protein